jgi:hypothetical protein
MDDTPSEVRRMMFDLLMALPPEERFVRGALMFDAAREMVIASLPPNLSPEDFRRALYERIYGEPLPRM